MMRTMLAVLGVLLAAAVRASAQYRIIDLGTLGGVDSAANAINEAGQIVGTVSKASGIIRPSSGILCR